MRSDACSICPLASHAFVRRGFQLALSGHGDILENLLIVRMCCDKLYRELLVEERRDDIRKLSFICGCAASAALWPCGLFFGPWLFANIRRLQWQCVEPSLLFVVRLADQVYFVEKVGHGIQRLIIVIVFESISGCVQIDFHFTA